MSTLKLTAIGTSTGVVLPKEMLVRMRVKKGDTIYVVETPDGYHISPVNHETTDQVGEVTSEPVWITKQALLYIHEESLAQFGGLRGVRDMGMLESALNRPENKYRYEPDTSIHHLASAYCFGIAKNHPFFDGNKRAAFLACYVFLKRNGFQLDADQIEAELAVLELVDGSMSEDDYAEWLIRHSQ
jgi:death-on-curing protein